MGDLFWISLHFQRIYENCLRGKYYKKYLKIKPAWLIEIAPHYFNAEMLQEKAKNIKNVGQISAQVDVNKFWWVIMIRNISIIEFLLSYLNRIILFKKSNTYWFIVSMSCWEQTDLR